MSPDLIEQLHRMEKKIDALLEYYILREELNIPNINEKSVCPMCIELVKWKQNSEGEVIRDCGCKMTVRSIDLNLFKSPEKKDKK